MLPCIQRLTDLHARPLRAAAMTTNKHNDRDGRFKEVAWPFMADLLRVALILTHNRNEADDLVQETFLKAWRAFDTFTVGTDTKAWLMTILRRTHIDQMRSDGRHVRCVEFDDDPRTPQHSAEAPDELDRKWANPRRMLENLGDEVLVRALKTLPEEILWTVLLVHVERLDHEQAAAILHVPLGTVKSRAHRGRQMLRERLPQTATVDCRWCEVPAEQCNSSVACSDLVPCPSTCAPQPASVR